MKNAQFWYIRKEDMESSLKALQEGGVDCIHVSEKSPFYGSIVFSYYSRNYGIFVASNRAAKHDIEEG